MLKIKFQFNLVKNIKHQMKNFKEEKAKVLESENN